MNKCTFKKITNIIFVSLLLVMLILYTLIKTNLGGFTDKVVSHFYPEKIVTIEQLQPVDYMFYDFVLNDDGSITAQTKEARLALFFDYLDINNVHRLDMYVDYSSVENTAFSIYTVESYLRTWTNMHEGIVNIPLEKLSSDDVAIRLDIGVTPGNTYRISKLVFNDTGLMASQLTRIVDDTVFGIIYCVLLAFIIYLGRLIRARFSNINALCLNVSESKAGNMLLGNRALLVTVSFSVGITGFMSLMKVQQLFLLAIPVLACLLLGVSDVKIIYYKNKYVNFGIAAFNIAFMSIVSFAILTVAQCDSNIWFSDDKQILALCAFLSVYYVFMALNIQAYFDCVRYEKDEKAHLNKGYFIPITIIYVIVELVIDKRLFVYDNERLLSHLKILMKHGSLYMNILLVYIMLLIIANILGEHIGLVLMGIVGFIILVGNLIKIKYQNSILTLNDLKIINEAIGIADAYVSKLQITLIIAALAALIALCVLFRKRIGRFLKPSFCVAVVFLIPFSVVCISSFAGETFFSKYIYYSEEPATDSAKVSEYGVILYYSEAILGNSGTSETEKPDGYSKSMYDFVGECEVIDSDADSSVKPDVILIMAESLCDIGTNQTDVTFNEDPFADMREWQVANVVSPSYGGRTVMSEYEALTGLSNYTISSDSVVYTTYINSNTKPIGSLVRDFDDNGYITTAMHPNVTNYYNRDVVYNNLGFDSFKGNSDFAYSSDDLLGDGRLNDMTFMENVVTQLESTDEPQFIFGVTFGGHSPYTTKYNDTYIEAYSDSVTGSDLDEVRCYAQTVYDLDEAVKYLHDYVMERDYPTVVYVWGDHLPALGMFNNYLGDAKFKYTVPMIAFSNYTDVEVGCEYISPNQISTQIIKDTGIEHSTYFDYVYSLRKDYPVLQGEWIGDVSDNIEIQRYSYIQYDLLFGKRYLLEK